MTFEEIVIAAIKEAGGKNLTTNNHGYWGWKWEWGGYTHDLFCCRQDTCCSFYWAGTYLFALHESDLLDPNWSPDTLAAQINGGFDDFFAQFP